MGEGKNSCKICNDDCNSCIQGKSNQCTVKCANDQTKMEPNWDYYGLSWSCNEISSDGSSDNSDSKCHKACETCTKEMINGYCLTCAANYIPKEDQPTYCRLTCNDGQYWADTLTGDGGECLPCNSNCKTCNGPSGSECLSCEEEVNNDGNYYHMHSKIPNYCIRNCDIVSAGEGKYWEEGDFFDGGKCKDCYEKCLSCTGPSAFQCLICKPPIVSNKESFLPPNYNNLCPPVCADNEFWSEEIQTSDLIVEVNQKTSGYTGTCVCEMSGISHTIIEDTKDLCEAGCISGEDIECSEIVDDNSDIGGDRILEPRVLDGENPKSISKVTCLSATSASGSCLQCDTETTFCTKCIGNTMYSCTECSSTHELFNGYCKKKCSAAITETDPAEAFVWIPYDNTTCGTCGDPVHCAQCVDSAIDQCIECITGYELNPKEGPGYCQIICNDVGKYWKDNDPKDGGSCHDCDQTCLSCEGSATNCASHNNNVERVENNIVETARLGKKFFIFIFNKRMSYLAYEFSIQLVDF